MYPTMYQSYIEIGRNFFLTASIDRAKMTDHIAQ